MNIQEIEDIIELNFTTLNEAREESSRVEKAINILQELQEESHISPAKIKLKIEDQTEYYSLLKITIRQRVNLQYRLNELLKTLEAISNMYTS